MDTTIKTGVYVRARTADNRWATVAAEDLTDKSFKIFVLQKLAEAGIVAHILSEDASWSSMLETHLTKAECDE